MFNHRFFPYIITLGTIAFLSICFVGHKAYQKHVEFEDFMSKTKILQGSLDIGPRSGSSQNAEDPGEESKESNVLSEGQATSNNVLSEGQATSNKTSSGTYKYNSDAEGSQLSDVQKQDLVSRFIDFGTELSGNPDSEQRSFFMSPEESEFFFSQDHHEINGRSVSTVRFESVTQLVETPDGEIHEVIVPRNWAYQDGDAIGRSELAPQLTRTISESITMDGVKYDMPEKYFTMDVYEQHQYKKKLTLAHYNGISIDEVERGIAAGEIEASRVSLSQQEKGRIDEKIRKEREQSRKTPLLDQSPVKVSFLADDSTGPGWGRDISEFIEVLGPPEETQNSRNDTTLPFVSPQRAVKAPDVSVSPSNLSSEVDPIPSPQSIAELENQLTPQGIEAELGGGLSTAPADKAQQLIDRYGTEEGLRRLRGSDPDAAERFERDRRPSRDAPKSDESPPESP